MENASKALMMAGGMLIALLIIGSVMLMFNQIGNYQKANSDSDKNSQLASFNQEFLRYADGEKIKGVDIISVANKVADYNKKSGLINSVDYDKKMELEINLAPSPNNDFIKKYGTNGESELFGKTKIWEVSTTNIKFIDIVTQFSALEKRYTLKTMSKLSANYDSIASGKKTPSEVAGKEIDIELGDIRKYREYSEFKSSTFISKEEPKYDKGQIVKLFFEFVK